MPFPLFLVSLFACCHLISPLFSDSTLVLRPLNTRPDGSGAQVLSFQIFDIPVAILLSPTIATPPAVAPSTKTPPLVSHTTLIKHPGPIGQLPLFFSLHTPPNSPPLLIFSQRPS